MDVVLYVIPLIVFIVILLIRHDDGINKKSILQSVGILAAAIVLYLVLTYLFKFMTNAISTGGVLIAVAILIDVVLKGIILFAETILYRKVFGLNGKIYIWTYFILVGCIILSSVLYYLDYAEVFIALKEGIDDTSFLTIATYMPGFVNVRRLLSLIPIIVVIVESFAKIGKHSSDK